MHTHTHAFRRRHAQTSALPVQQYHSTDSWFSRQFANPGMSFQRKLPVDLSSLEEVVGSNPGVGNGYVVLSCLSLSPLYSEVID